MLPSLRRLAQEQLARETVQPETKADATMVTQLDRHLASALRRDFGKVFQEAKFNVEDLVGIQNDPTCDNGDGINSCGYTLLIDPIDGTRAFANRSNNSTTIVALVETSSGRLRSVAIGDPLTLRVFLADESRAFMVRYASNLDQVIETVDVSVSKGDLDQQSTVLLDVAHPFTRENREILRRQDVDKLLLSITHAHRLSIVGSNGMNYIITVSGGTNVAGGYATALGGPWDAAGALLIKSAGGEIRAFSVDSVNNLLIPRDPLDINTYDVLVYGNSSRTVDTLVDLLQNAFSPNHVHPNKLEGLSFEQQRVARLE